MNNLAPRQGIFAIILLISFCLHVLMLMFNTEKQQYDYRTDKGEKIVEQLSKEAMVALANQDRISLSVLANRYQVDSDVAKLIISDPKQQVLVQTGQSQNETGQTIAQQIVDNSQTLGTVSVTMRAISKGEIIGDQWLYILGSMILHVFLWIIYGYVARPTARQLEQIGEKVQQRIAIARGSLPDTTTTSDKAQTNTATSNPPPDDVQDQMPKRSIQDFLQPKTVTLSAQDTVLADTSVDVATSPTRERDEPTATVAPTPIEPQQSLELQIRFFDEFYLLQRVAPEIAKPYLQLCAELLSRACDSLFSSNNALINRYIKDVEVQNSIKFTDYGAVVHLTGKTEQLPLAAVLLSKLVIILNQVVYEKHRELSRFALPMTVGISLDSQFDDTQRLMSNHAKQDGLLLLLPKPVLKTLSGHVQFNSLLNPTSVSEREAVQYTGLAEVLMAELIHKRDEILTASDNVFDKQGQ